MSVRTSLGATRGRIVQQLLTETAFLSLLGGALGLALGLGVITLVRTWPLPEIHRLEETSLDAQAFGFTIVVSIGTSLLFGLFPALRLSRPDLHDVLKAGRRVAGTAGRTRIRNTLIVAEMALAVVLLVGAGLFLRSLWRLLDVPLGFNPRNVLAVTVNLPATIYHEPVQQVQFAERLLDRLKVMSGVEAVGISTAFPLTGRDRCGNPLRWTDPESPLFDKRQLLPCDTRLPARDADPGDPWAIVHGGRHGDEPAGGAH
jgi:hypothetical protein